MLSSVVLITILQVGGDLVSFIIATVCAFSRKNNYQVFFILNSIAFFVLALGDLYYNYTFRISHTEIKYSAGWIVTMSVSLFQFSQAYNWYSLIKKEKNNIFSIYNLPYLLFTLMVIVILVYYFITSKSYGQVMTLYQSASISLDMLAWFFALLCLARTQSTSILFLTLGCLMLVSGDLTSRCLYMFEMDKVASAQWIHVIWMLGSVTMMIGFLICLRKKTFKFCRPDSIQASCSSWVSITAFGAFIIGFIFLFFFNFTQRSTFVYSTLWDIPIPLMFTMITSVLLGNWCSKRMLSPVSHFLTRIAAFNVGENIKKEENFKPIKLYEFSILDDFINSSFNRLSTQLDREIKIAEQVAHDIRSPLSALDVVIQRIPEIEEHKKILLREAINHIRDITNNLERDASLKKEHKEKAVTQITVLLAQVLSERRAALSNQSIRINENFSHDSFGFFIEVIQSDMRRVLTNIINNACEAIGNKTGIIQVDLFKKESELIITITDNGPGIPEETTTHLFTRGFTTKPQGSGLGLCYAKETLANWAGDIKLHSQIGEGTTLSIKLPLVPVPYWFVSNLSFLNDESVICIDDSMSIFHAWQERFNVENNNIDLHYCASKDELMTRLPRMNEKNCTYLVDYEFSGKKYTGIDLIKKFLLSGNNRIFLVTSRSSEKEIQDFCKLHQIFMIPKFFAFKIPIDFIKKQSEMIIVDPSFSSEHTGSIVSHNKYFSKYCNLNDLTANISVFKNGIPIFINEQYKNNNHLTLIKEKGFTITFYDNVDVLVKMQHIELFSAKGDSRD